MRKINIGSCILYSKSEAANSDICWNPRVLQLKANRILDILEKTSLFITQSSGSHSKGKKSLCRFNYSNPRISKCISWKHLSKTRNPFCTHTSTKTVQGWIVIHVFHFSVMAPAGIPAWTTPYTEHEPKILLHVFHRIECICQHSINMAVEYPFHFTPHVTVKIRMQINCKLVYRKYCMK